MSIKGDTAITDGYFGEVQSHFFVKAVPVHAEIGWCVALADQSRKDHVLFLVGALTPLVVVSQSPCVPRLPAVA